MIVSRAFGGVCEGWGMCSGFAGRAWGCTEACRCSGSGMYVWLLFLNSSSITVVDSGRCMFKFGSSSTLVSSSRMRIRELD